MKIVCGSVSLNRRLLTYCPFFTLAVCCRLDPFNDALWLGGRDDFDTGCLYRVGYCVYQCARDYSEFACWEDLEASTGIR